MPRTSSTSSIIGTGFMKCMPMNLPGRSVFAASRVTESDELLVQMIACSGSSPLSALKIDFLTASSSMTASITMSTPLMASRPTAVAMRSSAAARCSSVIPPLRAWRLRLVPIVSSAASSSACPRSISVTSYPATAATWAMPLPMRPAPMIPIDFTMAADQAFETPWRSSSSASAGRALNRSATRPKSAIWKIGASSSLLMAQITRLSFIPARCWIAPEMPTAM